MCFVNLFQVCIIFSEHGLYDIYCLVFILETDYIASVCKCSCLFDYPNPYHWVQGSLCILLVKPTDGGIQILHIFTHLLLVCLLTYQLLRERHSHIFLRFVALSLELWKPLFYRR